MMTSLHSLTLMSAARLISLCSQNSKVHWYIQRNAWIGQIKYYRLIFYYYSLYTKNNTSVCTRRAVECNKSPRFFFISVHLPAAQGLLAIAHPPLSKRVRSSDSPKQPCKQKWCLFPSTLPPLWPKPTCTIMCDKQPSCCDFCWAVIFHRAVDFSRSGNTQNWH